MNGLQLVALLVLVAGAAGGLLVAAVGLYVTLAAAICAAAVLAIAATEYLAGLIGDVLGRAWQRARAAR